MNVTETIGDLIEVPPVQTVIRLEEGRTQSLEIAGSFVFTGEVASHCAVVAESLMGRRGQGYFLQGDFGSGKSHFLAAVYALILTRETSMILNYKDSGVIQSEVSFHGDSAIVFVKVDTADFVTRPVPAVGDTLYNIEDSLASRVLFRDNFYTPQPPGTIKEISFINGTDTIAATMQTTPAKTGEVILFLVKDPEFVRESCWAWSRS